MLLRIKKKRISKIVFFEFKFPEMRCARREDPVLLEEGVGTHPFIKMSIASAGTHGEEGRRRRRGESERESVGRGRTGRSSGPASFGWRRWRLFFLSFFFFPFTRRAFVYKQSK